jgi:photosystem II stability/assembly factor-like uncharacterized protein
MGLLTPSDGWVLARGALLRTADGGRHWTDISPATHGVNAAFFLAPSIGWVATWDDARNITTYRTVDGGASWRNATFAPADVDPSDMGSFDLHFVDRNHGWLKRSWGNTAFYHGAVYQSTDGGVTWKDVARTVGGPIYFSDATTGWSIYGPLYVTRDAGYTWQTAPLGGQAWQLPTFFDPANGVTATVSPLGDGSSLDFYVTHDSGRSWTPSGHVQAARGNADTAGIISPTTWLASVPTGQTFRLFRTTNAAGAWTPIGSIDQHMDAFAFANAQIGWGHTSYGTCSGHKTGCVYRNDLLATLDGGRTWSRVDVTPTSAALPSVEATSTPAYLSRSFRPIAIQRLNARTGFAAGWMGTGMGLATTSDGGATWQRMAIPATGISKLRFIDERVGWVAGDVLRDSPRIACWQPPPTGTPECHGTVLRTEDGGQTWQETLSTGWDGARGDPVRQLEAVDGQLAWVLTLTSPCDSTCPTQLRRTTDGGKTWAMLLRGDISVIRFASASRGWLAVVDPQGSVEIRTTSDGGTTWTSGRTVGTTSWSLLTLDAATTQSAWLLTGDLRSCSASTCGTYELFRTTDGGMSWISLGNPKDTAGGNCSMGFLVGPLFASTTRGWLTLNLGAGGGNGPGGVLMTDDGGRSWRCSSPPTDTSLISAADPLHVWLWSEKRVTGATGLYATDDGGRTWHPLDLSALS